MQKENEPQAQRERARVLPAVIHFSEAGDRFRTWNSRCCPSECISGHTSHFAVSWLTSCCAERKKISQRRAIVAMVEEMTSITITADGIAVAGVTLDAVIATIIQLAGVSVSQEMPVARGITAELL